MTMCCTMYWWEEEGLVHQQERKLELQELWPGRIKVAVDYIASFTIYFGTYQLYAKERSWLRKLQGKWNFCGVDIYVNYLHLSTTRWECSGSYSSCVGSLKLFNWRTGKVSDHWGWCYQCRERPPEHSTPGQWMLSFCMSVSLGNWLCAWMC